MSRNHWTLNEKEFWIDRFSESLTILLENNPQVNNEEKWLPFNQIEQNAMDRVELAGRIADKAVKEGQFRFWDKDKYRDSRVKFGQGRGDKGKGESKEPSKGSSRVQGVKGRVNRPKGG